MCRLAALQTSTQTVKRNFATLSGIFKRFSRYYRRFFVLLEGKVGKDILLLSVCIRTQSRRLRCFVSLASGVIAIDDGVSSLDEEHSQQLKEKSSKIDTPRCLACKSICHGEVCRKKHCRLSVQSNFPQFCAGFLAFHNTACWCWEMFNENRKFWLIARVRKVSKFAEWIGAVDQGLAFCRRICFRCVRHCRRKVRTFHRLILIKLNFQSKNYFFNLKSAFINC